MRNYHAPGMLPTRPSRTASAVHRSMSQRWLREYNTCRPHSDEKLRRLFAAAEEGRTTKAKVTGRARALAYRLAALTGLRRNEVETLARHSDVNLTMNVTFHPNPCIFSE